MKLIDEAYLRAARIPAGTKQYLVPEGTVVTPLAKEYLAARKINLVVGKTVINTNTMTVKPIPKSGPKRFIDAATGENLSKKPEHMTHLQDNLLVPKTHPRIMFRGKLDSLEAKIIELQIKAKDCGKDALSQCLQEALCYVRAILAAEVNEKELQEGTLFGYDSDGLRKISHNIKEAFGFDHPVPSADKGIIAARLNTLRTQVRECELAAVAAFGKDRTDIVRALNRLSSGIYILFCREIAGCNERGTHERNRN